MTSKFINIHVTYFLFAIRYEISTGNVRIEIFMSMGSHHSVVNKFLIASDQVDRCDRNSIFQT